MNLIENINYTSILKYGLIEHDGFQDALKKYSGDGGLTAEYSVNVKEVETLYSYDHAVVLDPLSGLCLLYLTGSAEENGCFYLLDKTVVINPDIFFNVISLYGNCSYKLGYLHPGRSVRLPIPAEGPLGMSSKINIIKIHTLFYQEKEKGFAFKGEAHDFLELTYIDKGKMYTEIDNKTILLEQGDVIFYNLNQFHTQWCDSNQSVSFITLTFDMDIDPAVLFGRSHAVDNEIKALLQKIIFEKENNSLYSEDLILCYLKEFIIKLVRNLLLEKTIVQQDSEVRTRIDDTIIEKCIDFIEKNIENKISVPEVARSIPISPSYLTLIFRKKTGVTVVDYINNFRLEKSKELINTSSLNFSQISEKLGYSSIHYFSRQFKLKYGISPSEYSRAIKR
ncbi:MAG: hypothetical protein K0R50_1197 [Eubacterium sp.]|nr:hypothetical protein [Eubacterium sp.]